MIEDFKNPHGKPTKQMNSIEFLLEQVVMGTYEYGEDKILHTTLPKSMIDHAKEIHKKEIINAMSVAFMDGSKIGAINYTSPYKDWEQYYNETYGNEQQ